MIIKDEDIVSTSRESLEKFIRELHRVTTYVKIMRFIHKSNIHESKYKLHKKDNPMCS